MNEIWRSAKDYEGLYEVSNLGRVRNVVSGVILKPVKDRDGYLQVTLYSQLPRKNFKIHRLVAQAFLPNHDNLPQVNHKDENKENNRVDNLEWCNAEYNHNYGTRNARVGKAKSRVVYMYTQDDKLCGLWPSTNECERNGFNHALIVACCSGKRNLHKGFKWSYEPPKPPKALSYSIP